MTKRTYSYLLISYACEERLGGKSLHAINLHTEVISFCFHERRAIFFLNFKEPKKVTQSMVISISSASSNVESEVVTASPTPIMEDNIGNVPP